MEFWIRRWRSASVHAKLEWMQLMGVSWLLFIFWLVEGCPVDIVYILMSAGTKVIHRFVRNANIESSIYNRVANRFSPFENTQLTLTDPATQRTLTLIGTTNSSNTLAHRTKGLLEKLKPDAVYVQASETWWSHARHTEIDNQQLFLKVNRLFPKQDYRFENNLRGLLFRARYYAWRYAFEGWLQLPQDFNLFRPGLETYFTCKYAEAAKARTYFGGGAFDPATIEALRLQPDLYPHTLLWNAMVKTTSITSSWTSQYDDFINTLHVRGGEAFSESIDRSRINFLVALLNRVAPKQKKILIDDRGEQIFRELICLKEKNVVAVVNQWHMELIETFWRHHTGTEVKQPQLSPVADMDIDAIKEKELVNEWLREYVSDVTKSEPATWQDYLTNYHKENFEYERTRHTHHDSHEDIAEPGQKGHHHH